MRLVDELLETLPEGAVEDVRIGLHWTCVVVQVEGERSCGLASSLSEPHGHGTGPDVPEAGRLTDFAAAELASWAKLEKPALASLGVAALNALIPKRSGSWEQTNAEHVIAERGAGKSVAIVGHFPFVERIKEQAAELYVLERHPRGDDLPEEAAPEILPRMDVVAITGMTLINHTLERMLSLCPPEAFVLVLGPSTPLSPVLFTWGVNSLSGSVVMDVDDVVLAVSQGANFRQVHRAGVKLVTVGEGDFG